MHTDIIPRPRRPSRSTSRPMTRSPSRFPPPPPPVPLGEDPGAA